MTDLIAFFPQTGQRFPSTMRGRERRMMGEAERPVEARGESTAGQAEVTREVPPRSVASTQVTQVVETVTVQQVPSRTDLTTDEADWTWSELRDYVVAQIVERFGPFPRNSKKEYGVFSRFIAEHGQDGVLVARAAFEVYDGWWKGAPISVNRFTKNSDRFFVEPILERIKNS